MPTLYLLRHAKSSWDDPALPDRERPLAPRGVRDAKRVAKHLRRAGVAPQLVLCSPSTRTRDTLELLRSALGEAEVAVEEELYAASGEELLVRLRALSEQVESVLLVGHNPGLQDLALALARDGRERARLEEKFPTAALATLTAPAWSGLCPGGAELVDYVVPRELG